jgi:hypothetical protein
VLKTEVKTSYYNGKIRNYRDEIAHVASAMRARAGHAEPAVSRQSVVGAMLWLGTQQRVLLSPAFSL